MSSFACLVGPAWLDPMMAQLAAIAQ